MVFIGEVDVFINVFIVIIWYLWQLNRAGEIILVYIFIQKLQKL